MSGLQSELMGGGGIKYWVTGTNYAQGVTVRSPTDHQLWVRIVAGAGATDPVSDAANWRPDGGRPRKSIQRGVISIAYPGNSGTATISAVDTAKTELRLLGGGGLTSGALYPNFPMLTLTNSTTVTAILTVGSPGSPNPTPISWELTEYH